VQLYGVLQDGTPFVVEDDRYRPGFFVTPAALERHVLPRELTLESSSLCSLSGERVVRVSAARPDPLMRFRQTLELAGVELFEADLRPAYAYLIDHGLRSGVQIVGAAEPAARSPGSSARPRLRYVNPELRPAECSPKLRLLSLDIETTPDASRVLSVALAGCGVEEVHWVPTGPCQAAAISHADERSLLRALVQRIVELDPDVITGWNVIDFDLRVLLERARACRVAFEIGRTRERVQLRRDESFLRQSRAEVPGRQVLDGLTLVRDGVPDLPDYRLETVAQSLVGRGKRIRKVSGSAAEEILRLYQHEPDAFITYNLEDARLVTEILERQSLLELTLERSLLTGMPLDRVSASIASFDRVYLPELHRRGHVAPCVRRERKHAAVRGGAVLDSTAGFFHNVAVFDFRSLYPSLIRTFGLDPLAHARAAGREDALTAPNGARFARGVGILPEVLAGYAARRAEAKACGDRRRDLAIKLLMNSFFGVLGSASCRFFDAELANAITGFGQQILLRTQSLLRELGAHVLYGDTDSVFVELGEQPHPDIARDRAEELRRGVQRRLHTELESRYRVEPELELEFEHLYLRFFQPALRGGTKGSKKRYAGWLGDELEVVGLEAVRRDSPGIAKELQLGLLSRAFRDEPLLPFVAECARSIRSPEQQQSLVIRKRLRKGAVGRYEGRKAPHVEAARKAGLHDAREVRYVMTRSGAEPVIYERPFPANIDYDYYLKRVMQPVADSVLRPLGLSFDEALGRPRQLQLL